MIAAVDPLRLCQIEIFVSDLARSADFYAKAFGWQAVPAQLHDYVILSVPEGCSFGISLVARPSGASQASPAGLLIYFAVEDPEVLLRQVVSCGGQRLGGPTPVAGYGMTFQCADPDGTRFGLYMRAPAQGGRNGPKA